MNTNLEKLKSTKLSCREVADILGVKETTLAQWRSRKIGPDYIKIGKKIWYFSEVIERYIFDNIVDLEVES